MQAHHTLATLLAGLMILCPAVAAAPPQDEEFPRPTQPWASSFERPMRSIFTEQFVQQIGDWFELTDDQRILLGALHDDHVARFAGFVAEHEPIHYTLDRAWWDLRDDPPAQLAKSFEREEVLAKVADEQERVDMLFLPDIQVILTEEQLERWDMFELWLVRQRWGTRGSLYLEQPIDLIALLEELGRVVQETQVPPEVVEEFARQMDKALRDLAKVQIEFSRNRVRADADRHRTDGERVWLDVEGEYPGVQKHMEALVALQKRIRDLNRTYEQVFRSHLRDEHVAAWQRIYRESVLRRITRDSGMPDETNDLILNSFRMVRPLEDLLMELDEAQVALDPEQRETIDSLVLQHEHALQANFQSILRAQEALGDANYESLPRNEGTRLHQEYRDALAATVELRNQAIERILATLTPEQREALQAGASMKNEDESGAAGDGDGSNG